MQWQSENCEEGFLSLLDPVLTDLQAAQVIAVLAALSKLHKFQAEAGDSKVRKESDQFRHLSSHESWLFTGFVASVNIYSTRFQKSPFQNHHTRSLNGSRTPEWDSRQEVFQWTVPQLMLYACAEGQYFPICLLYMYFFEPCCAALAPLKVHLEKTRMFRNS